jgi:membrane-associated phospholipid phosphatase
MMVNNNAFPVHWAIAYPIGIAIIIAAAICGYKLSQKSTNPELLKTVILLTIVSLVVMVIIMSTKGIMNRPRFRFVLESSNPYYFKNWWQNGNAIKSSLASNVVSDEFSSFPSGHSAYSMFAIFLFPVISDYFPKLEKHRILFFALGFIWWALTALSRITVGAHYLTDVSIAGIITILAYIIVYATTKKHKKRKTFIN